MNVSNLIKNSFFITSLSSYLIYFILTAVFSGVNNMLLSVVLNLLNALGGVTLVTALYDVTFREKYQNETTKEFVKTIFLEKEYIEQFTDETLNKMLLNIQKQLLRNQTNIDYKNRVISLIQDKIMPMGNATHEDERINSYFEHYAEEVIYEKSNYKKVIKCTNIIEYKLINGSENKMQQVVLTEKFIPNLPEGITPLKLIKLEVSVDGTTTIYDVNEFTYVETDKKQDSLSSDNGTSYQIQRTVSTENKVFSLDVHKFIYVKKEIELYISYDDVIYGHTFHRPLLNYDLRLRDENATKVSAIMRSAFHKNQDDTISMRNIRPNEIRITLVNDLLLPKEGVAVISIRS